MIDAAQRARIRRLFFAEHWKVGTIATELGVHRDAVHHAIESDRFVSAGSLVRPSMLDPYKGLVGEILKDHPRLLATRMFGMLRDRGYPGSVVQLRRYVKTVRPQRVEAYLRLQTLPGDQPAAPAARPLRRRRARPRHRRGAHPRHPQRRLGRPRARPADPRPSRAAPARHRAARRPARA